MLQRIRMLKTQKGVNDGDLHPSTYIEGQEYEVGPELLNSFIELGIVELADDEKGVEQKSKGNAPANKARVAAPENKAAK